MDNWPSSAAWVLNPQTVRDLLQKLQVQEHVIAYMCQASQQVAQSKDIPDFFQFCASWQQHLGDAYTNNLPSSWKALAVIAAYPKAIELYHQRDVPWEIIRTTLADFQRDARGDYLTGTSWEFERLAWMTNHVNARIFELGRLQFVPALFNYPYRIYRDTTTGAPIAFALADLHCTSDGWLNDTATGFVTQFSKNADGIHGHPASPQNGSISGKIHRITPQSPLLVDDSTTVLQIHIPSGRKLDIEECIDSLKTALTFFARYFPDTPIAAFCTSTWLLDPELTKVLLPDSNILKFAKLFHPLAHRNANDAQLLERVFGKGSTWENCSAQTSLQNAVLQHHQNCGVFRMGSGYILADEVTQL